MDGLPLFVVMPCFNEGQIIGGFLQDLERTLAALPYTFRILVVDDGSTDDTAEVLRTFRFSAPSISLEVITLAANTGHQSAIYGAFQHIATTGGGHIIVMDADGEDSPSVIPQLLRYMDADVVHVVRGRRREPVLFRIGYYCYKAIFRLLTGKRMNYGNFCMISPAVLQHAVAARFTHLAAFLSRQKLNTRYVVAERAHRLGGQSKMSFVKLLRHAAGSFAEYGYGSRLTRSKSQ